MCSMTFLSLTDLLFFSCCQHVLICAGQWEAAEFSAPVAGFRDTVSFSALCDMLQQARMWFILHQKG